MIPAPNTMLMGGSGTGKTHSIRTLHAAGIKCFCLFTEPGMEILGDISCEDGMHWRYIPPTRVDWDTMLKNADLINTRSMKELASYEDLNKTQYKQFLRLLQSFKNFTCDRCQQDFGDVSTWNTDRALILDSLSGLNVMAMDSVAGGKPLKSMANWGIAMDGIERLFNKLTTDTTCWFITIAHTEREVDEVTGGQYITASTLGRKLAPKLPRFFSDVIQTVRTEKEFTWSTATVGVDTKARNLPWDRGMPPDFRVLINAWKARGGTIEPTSADALDASD
jgi:hypothetical protein